MPAGWAIFLYEEYQQVFDDWISEGIIEKVPNEEVKDDAYYLPHRSVIKANSTTKIRPVFDASATGEDSRILLRFRRREIGITADIRKAFLQISVSPEDRDVLRFIWWKKNRPEEMEIYRHRRVVFGVSSSPFLLGATIEYHLEKTLQQVETEKEKEVIRQLKKSFYVDNCVTSVNSRSEAIAFEATAGQDKEQDTLKLTPTLLELPTTPQVTKRNILSAAQRIFDPIGVSSPISIKPKQLLQKLWSCKISWDDEVPEDVKADFNDWLQQLHWLKELCIPRWAFRQEGNMSFHVFVDASQEAYAATVFARTETQESAYVQLIQAKSRVTPIERMTTPRLELLAATIGVRLWQSIRETEDFEEAEVFFWSDSAAVLAWIQNNRPWNTFVGNRVKEIRLLSDPNHWRHVPGSMNPADLPSRGCGAKQLLESRWWEGPAWLRLPRNQWPSTDCTRNETEIDSEIKKSTYRNKKKPPSEDILTVETHITVPQEEIGWYMEGQYLRIVRNMAWIRRFIINCRVKRSARLSGELNTKEFIDAELVILKLTQAESFDEVNEPRLSTLDTYREENGLLRLKSSVVNREDEHNFRHPIVLDPKHPLVKKLIEYRHKQLNHAGTQTVMNDLRETFWIACRPAVRTVIHNCWRCNRYKVKMADATTGCLPYERVKEANVFEVTGIDYIGPLYLKKGQKAWICLFTCAVYRGIHLELTTVTKLPHSSRFWFPDGTSAGII
ncbi:PREDICTED: uncharacterized protein LOC105556364 [Vollenhovia emeryi]|uniref:uncharacterized protein LOC105556364 n=1 Tax=Vollenhovia emeryi TaxID=411798 RepID=UPI0005F42DCC|nr:PREDICTED: uncharacterized protein LOC105556364 [Vollenhovia emeryi]